MHPEMQYLLLLQDIINNGTWKQNRTGIRTKFLPGGMLKFDLSRGFPLLTSKKMYTPALIGELLAFLEGATSAERFRELGCKFWDQNANENKDWLNNPHRKGHDDVGHIYGYIWNHWDSFEIMETENTLIEKHPPRDTKFTYNADQSLTYHNVTAIKHSINQILTAVNRVYYNPEDRRIIITAWKIDEFHKMSLPPCHVSYEFLVDTENNKLHLTMWQRSCDMFLGVPMNIASASLLLHCFARITGLEAGTYTHFLSDMHIYENHMEQVKEQIVRNPMPFPTFKFDNNAPKLGFSFDANKIYDFKPEHFIFENYQSHSAIKAPMAV